MSEPQNGAASAGALLRAAREKQGLHIAALAAAIKVAPRKLDALENDRWDELPDATFARALAQTVCRTLKLDPRAVLALLPPSAAQPFEATRAGLNAPFRDRPGRADPGLAGSAIRPMIWAAVLLMAAAVAVYLLPEGLWKPRAPASLPAVAARAPEVPLAPAPALAASEAMPVADAEPAPAASAPPAPPVPSSAPGAMAAAPVLSRTAPVAAGPDATAAAVQLRASAESWVEARDARGLVLMSRIVLPGEGVGLDGSLPIRLTIGNAAVTQLTFRGAAVDLAASTHDNVARVELK